MTTIHGHRLSARRQRRQASEFEVARRHVDQLAGVLHVEVVVRPHVGIEEPALGVHLSGFTRPLAANRFSVRCRPVALETSVPRSASVWMICSGRQVLVAREQELGDQHALGGRLDALLLEQVLDAGSGRGRGSWGGNNTPRR